jgi:hypothetical protein
MGRSIGFLVLIITVGIGGYAYMKQAQSITSVGSNPQTAVDVTAVRNDLMTMATAERNYFASNGKYVSLEQLKSGGDITVPNRANYSYSSETSESTFEIIAVYSGPDPKAPKRLTVDQTMALTTN